MEIVSGVIIALLVIVIGSFLQPIAEDLFAYFIIRKRYTEGDIVHFVNNKLEDVHILKFSMLNTLVRPVSNELPTFIENKVLRSYTAQILTNIHNNENEASWFYVFVEVPVSNITNSQMYEDAKECIYDCIIDMSYAIADAEPKILYHFIHDDSVVIFNIGVGVVSDKTRDEYSHQIREDLVKSLWDNGFDVGYSAEIKVSMEN